MPSNGGIIGPVNVPDQDGKSKITAFNSSGTFTISTNNTLDTATVLVVAGGGGGQTNGGAGGGGAGGLR